MEVEDKSPLAVERKRHLSDSGRQLLRKSLNPNSGPQPPPPSPELVEEYSEPLMKAPSLPPPPPPTAPPPLPMAPPPAPAGESSPPTLSSVYKHADSVARCSSGQKQAPPASLPSASSLPPPPRSSSNMLSPTQRPLSPGSSKKRPLSGGSSRGLPGPDSPHFSLRTEVTQLDDDVGVDALAASFRELKDPSAEDVEEGGTSMVAPVPDQVRATVDADDHILVEGWLSKKGLRGMWSNYYFIMKPGVLQYYTDEPVKAGSKLRGTIVLDGGLVYLVGGMPRSFVVQVRRRGASPPTVYCLRATTEDAVQLWMEQCRLFALEPSRTGWLWKQGHILRSWRRRFFVLESSNAHYFLSPWGHWKGTIDLARAKIETDEDTPIQFHVLTWSDDEKNYLMHAEDSKSREAWCRALRTSSLNGPSIEDIDGYRMVSPKAAKGFVGLAST